VPLKAGQHRKLILNHHLLSYIFGNVEAAGYQHSSQRSGTYFASIINFMYLPSVLIIVAFSLYQRKFRKIITSLLSKDETKSILADGYRLYTGIDIIILAIVFNLLGLFLIYLVPGDAILIFC
jgi:hypothetical protein